MKLALIFAACIVAISGEAFEGGHLEKPLIQHKRHHAGRGLGAGFGGGVGIPVGGGAIGGGVGIPVGGGAVGGGVGIPVGGGIGGGVGIPVGGAIGGNVVPVGGFGGGLGNVATTTQNFGEQINTVGQTQRTVFVSPAVSNVFSNVGIAQPLQRLGFRIIAVPRTIVQYFLQLVNLVGGFGGGFGGFGGGIAPGIGIANSVGIGGLGGLGGLGGFGGGFGHGGIIG